jgi:glycyl-tRNA synthetase beta chain
MADFLLEIGLEEVPDRMIAGAEAELGRRVNDLLTRERLLGPAGTLTTYSTPRRLAVLVEDVLASQADTEEQLTGPSWKVAFKDGEPTAAAEAFAKKAGVAVTALEKVSNAKGEYVGATVKRLGRTTAELLASELPKEVLSIYWAKNMYWRAGKPERFVRPVRWVVAVLDSAVVPLEIAGIAAGNASRGHRVLHGEKPVVLDLPKNYSERLRAASVVVDAAERRQSIRKALDAAVKTVAGARWREDAGLIEIVVHLTEWPSVVLGNFEAEYLALPEEVLVTARPPEVLCCGECGRQAGAAFPGGAEYRSERRGTGDYPAWKRAGAQGAVQGCAVLLGLRSEDAAGGACGEPEERHFPEGTWQLSLED